MPISGGQPAGVGFYDAYVCVRDKKAQNTVGGTSTPGGWRTRDINDEHADTAGICSLSSNQITLAAGTYRCIISCPHGNIGRNQARLYNITDSVTLLVGTCQYAAAGAITVGRALVVGRFTLSAQKTLEVQHRCDATQVSYGLGVESNYTDEIYTVAEFWREV